MPTSQSEAGELAAPIARHRAYSHLLRTISTAAQHAGTLEDAFQSVLHEVCFRLGWPIGQLYILDPGSPTLLVATRIRHLDDPRRMDTLRQLVERANIPDGAGLRHKVVAHGSVQWIYDVTKDPTFSEAKYAAMLGVRAALAIPIKMRAQVMGVIEFFAREPLQPDDELLDVLRFTGDLLGWTLQRRQNDDELRRLRGEHQALLRSIQDCVYGVAPNGTISFVNPAAAQLLGYNPDDLVGQIAHDVLHHSRADGTPFAIDACPIHGSREANQSFLEVEETLWSRDRRPVPVQILRIPPTAGEESNGGLLVFRQRKGTV